MAVRSTCGDEAHNVNNQTGRREGKEVVEEEEEEALGSPTTTTTLPPTGASTSCEPTTAKRRREYPPPASFLSPDANFFPADTPDPRTPAPAAPLTSPDLKARRLLGALGEVPAFDPQNPFTWPRVKLDRGPGTTYAVAVNLLLADLDQTREGLGTNFACGLLAVHVALWLLRRPHVTAPCSSDFRNIFKQVSVQPRFFPPPFFCGRGSWVSQSWLR